MVFFFLSGYFYFKSINKEGYTYKDTLKSRWKNLSNMWAIMSYYHLFISSLMAFIKWSSFMTLEKRRKLIISSLMNKKGCYAPSFYRISSRIIVCSLSGPIETMTIGTPTSFSMNSTYFFALSGSSSYDLIWVISSSHPDK